MKQKFGIYFNYFPVHFYSTSAGGGFAFCFLPKFPAIISSYIFSSLSHIALQEVWETVADASADMGAELFAPFLCMSVC